MEQGVGQPPWPPATPLGAPSPPIKSPLLPLSHSHLLPKDLSPPLEFPHGLGSARYMCPCGFFWKDLLLPLLCWSEGVEVVGIPERVCDHGCTTALRCWT